MKAELYYHYADDWTFGLTTLKVDAEMLQKIITDIEMEIDTAVFDGRYDDAVKLIFQRKDLVKRLKEWEDAQSETD